jgi:methionyl-tRNA formyltransferase
VTEAAPSIAVLGSKATCLSLVERLVAQASTPISTIVTIDDSNDTRSALLELRTAAAKHGIPIYVATDTLSAYEALAVFEPSVVFVAGWYRLIGSDVLDSVLHGFVGVHYSLLPHYRGSAPVVWALMNGDTELGYSIFRLTDGMDEGPVAGQGAVPVDEGTYIGEALARLDHASLTTLVSLADDIAAGTAEFRAQPNTRASYAGARNPNDGWIDWSLPAAQIARAVRAQSYPYPGARTRLDATHVKIWRAYEDKTADYHGIPGQVIRYLDGNPVIACGHQTGLVLDEVEGLEGVRLSLLTSRFG